MLIGLNHSLLALQMAVMLMVKKEALVPLLPNVRTLGLMLASATWTATLAQDVFCLPFYFYLFILYHIVSFFLNF